MEQEHSRSRHIATRKFMSSLDDLDSVFRPEDESSSEASHPSPKDFSATAEQLEDAVRDIEQFIADTPERNP